MTRGRAVLSGFTLVLAATWLAAVVLFRIDERPLAIPVEGVTRVSGASVFAEPGTRVRAAASGFVVYVGTSPPGGRVVHVFGRRGMLYRYAHLEDSAPGLSIGDWVREGDALGLVGASGETEGTRPHLHFETRPLAYLLIKPLDPATLFRR